MDRAGLPGTTPTAVGDGSAHRQALVRQLVAASREFDATGADPERNCWLAVHRHVHGVLPSEYDIRDIDEDLYLAVLAARRAEAVDTASQLG